MVEKNPQAIARRARSSSKAIAAALALTVAAAVAISITSRHVDDANPVKILGPVSDAQDGHSSPSSVLPVVER